MRAGSSPASGKLVSTWMSKGTCAMRRYRNTGRQVGQAVGSPKQGLRATSTFRAAASHSAAAAAAAADAIAERVGWGVCLAKVFFFRERKGFLVLSKNSGGLKNSPGPANIARFLGRDRNSEFGIRNSFLLDSFSMEFGIPFSWNLGLV